MYDDVVEEEYDQEEDNLDCASMHEVFDFPVARPLEDYYHTFYHCLLYTLGENDETSTPSYVICSADVLGIYEHSEISKETAIEYFRQAIHTRIAEGLGGLYVGTSEFSFQHECLRELEEDWVSDGVIIVEKQEVVVRLFMNSEEEDDANVRIICD